MNAKITIKGADVTTKMIKVWCSRQVDVSLLASNSAFALDLGVPRLRSFEQEPSGKKPGAATDPRRDRDAPLVARVVAGDIDAAGDLVSRHADRIFAIGFRMLGNAEAAEDLTQDVFLKIWKNAGKWEPGRALFSTWLHRVTVNMCYDRLRKKREITVDDIGEIIDRRGGEEASAHKTLEGRATGDRIRRLISQLPERQSAAITLCHFEGFSNTQTAEILETTVEAVESLLARGRRKLKVSLRDEYRELIGGN
jgi:RNA polymerase sigma-70 factor, ECF subfamily